MNVTFMLLSRHGCGIHVVTDPGPGLPVVHVCQLGLKVGCHVVHGSRQRGARGAERGAWGQSAAPGSPWIGDPGAASAN